MKWMIRVDMEGLTGVTNMNQVIPGAVDYPFGLRMLKHDLEAVIDGLLQEPDDEVVLYDIHFYGTNVDYTDLDPRVTVIAGKPNYTPANGAFLRGGGYDGMILLGLHAKADTTGAVLNHNYEHDIRRLAVNGLVVGEIGLEALMAGEAGVPLAMVTGDDAGNRETLELLPDTVTVTVKESRGDTAAACYPPSKTGPLLREGARHCRQRVERQRPFALSGPIELELVFRPGELLTKLQSRLAPHFIGPDRLVLRGESVLEAWERYLIAKA